MKLNNEPIPTHHRHPNVKHYQIEGLMDSLNPFHGLDTVKGADYNIFLASEKLTKFLLKDFIILYVQNASSHSLPF